MAASPSQVNAVTTAFGLATNYVLTMPTAPVPQPDQLLIALASGDSISSDTMSGWTKIGTAANGSFVIGIFGKKAVGGGADTGTVAGSLAGRLGEVLVYKGWDGVLANIGIANATTNVINPPSLDMGASRDHAFLAYARANNASITAAPTSYGNLLTVASGTTVMLASADRQLTTQTEDPGAFTGTAASSVAGVIGIRPGFFGISADFLPFFA